VEGQGGRCGGGRVDGLVLVIVDLVAESTHTGLGKNRGGGIGL